MIVEVSAIELSINLTLFPYTFEMPLELSNTTLCFSSCGSSTILTKKARSGEIPTSTKYNIVRFVLFLFLNGKKVEPHLVLYFFKILVVSKQVNITSWMRSAKRCMPYPQLGITNSLENDSGLFPCIWIVQRRLLDSFSFPMLEIDWVNASRKASRSTDSEYTLQIDLRGLTEILRL